MSDKHHTWIALGLLTCLVLAAYGNSLQNGFAFDDAVMIVKNQLIQRLDYLPKLLTSDYWAGRMAPTEAASWTSGLYRPLVLLTFAMNYAVVGLMPAGYHLVNLGIHLLVTWFVYLLALRLGLRWDAALIAGALFAIHPLHTEAVTWIVGRAELLMAAGVLGAVVAHAAGRPVLALASFAVGLFSKEQAMVLPALLFLYDACFVMKKGEHPHARRTSHVAPLTLLKAYAGYVLVLIAYLAIRAKVLSQPYTVPVLFIDNPLAGLDGYLRTLNAMKVAGSYLWLSVWPASLSADYSYHAIPVAKSLFDSRVWLGLVSWGGLVVLAAWSFFKGTRKACFAVGLTVVSFLPASNLLIPIGTIMAERLFYLPSAGLCLLAAIAYETVRRATCDAHTKIEVEAKAEEGVTAGHLAPRTSHLERLFAFRLTAHVAPFLVIAICLALTVRTVQRNGDWASTETLMQSAVRVVPTSAKVHAVLGEIALQHSQLEPALDHLRRAMELYPDYIHTAVTINLNLGSALLKTGHAAEAVESFERAVTLDPGSSTTHYNLALAYTQRGLYSVAAREMRRAIALNPGLPDAHGGLGAILLQLGQYEEALKEAETALRLSPALKAAAADRAIALQALGRFDEADAASKQAGGIAPIPGMVGRKSP